MWYVASSFKKEKSLMTKLPELHKTVTKAVVEDQAHLKEPFSPYKSVQSQKKSALKNWESW